MFFFYWYILKLLKFSPIKIKKRQVKFFKHLWLFGLLYLTENIIELTPYNYYLVMGRFWAYYSVYGMFYKKRPNVDSKYFYLSVSLGCCRIHVYLLSPFIQNKDSLGYRNIDISRPLPSHSIPLLNGCVRLAYWLYKYAALSDQNIIGMYIRCLVQWEFHAIFTLKNIRGKDDLRTSWMIEMCKQ